MTTRQMVAAMIVAVMGTLQLWDSHVFSAGVATIAVSAVAVLLPVVTLLFVDRLEVRFGAVLACALLLLSAKLLAPHPLPALGVIAVFAAAANLLVAVRPSA